MESHGQDTSYQTDTGCYLFEDFRLCIRARELTRQGQPVVIENKALDFLIYLIQNRERAVSKQELHEVLWQNRPLSETVMARCVMKVRRAINDNGQRQSIVKTIPGYGYRFIADADIEARQHHVTPYITTTKRGDYKSQDLGNSLYLCIRHVGTTLFSCFKDIGSILCAYVYHYKHAFIFAALLLLFLTTLFYIQETTKEYPGPAVKLAVLPMKNATGDESLDWIEFGLMTAIEHSLAYNREIHTISSHEIMAKFTGIQTTRMEEKEIIDALRTSKPMRNSYLISTTLQRENDLFRLNYTVHIPNSASLSDNLVGEDPILLAASLGGRIVAQLNGNGQTLIRAAEISSDFLVQETYLRALQAGHNGDLKTARQLLNACLRLDPHAHWVLLELAKIESYLSDWPESESLLKKILSSTGGYSNIDLQLLTHNQYGELEWRRGDYQQAEIHFRQGLELSVLADDHKFTSMLLTNLGKVINQRGEYSKAEKLLKRALDLSTELNNPAEKAAALQELGRLAFYKGRLAIAKDYTSQALSIRYAQFGHRGAEADSLNEMGRIFQEFGKRQEAEIYFNKALIINRQQKDRWQETRVLINLARLKLEQGQLDKSSELLKSAINIAGDKTAAGISPAVRIQHALILAGMGQFQLAESQFEQARAKFASMGDVFSRTMATLKLGRLHLIQDRIEAAKAMAQNGLELARKLNNKYLMAHAYRLQANIEHSAKNLDLAENLYREALVLMQGLEFNQLKTYLVIDLGHLCLQKNKIEQTEALIASLKNRDSYYYSLFLIARLNYHLGRFDEALKFHLQAKQLAGQAWTEEAETLTGIYQAAAKTGKSIPIEDLSIIPFYI